jgi:hypothetical protein
LEESALAHTDNKITLVFIINGENFRVETNVNAQMVSAVEKALQDSGNTGRRNPDEWELRDSSGALLEIHRKVQDLGLKDGARLFLSLRVAAGGAK